MKTSKLLLFALGFAFSANLFAVDLSVKTKTENSIELSIKGDNKTRSIVTIREESQKPVAPEFGAANKYNPTVDFKSSDKQSFVIYDASKSEEIKINALKPEKKYVISAYTKDSKTPKETTIATFAVEPKKQTSGLAFKDVTDSQIGVLWLQGDGKNRMLCVTTSGTPAVPEDGKVYKSGKVGDNTCKIGNSNTYVVFNSAEKSAKEFLIKDLKYGKYTIQMFDYNGKDESVNYNTNSAKNNPRIKSTLLPPPLALDASEVKDGGFTANWKEMKDIAFYEFDLSTESDFSNFVDVYQSADVGNLNKFEITELKSGTYYYRLRAVTEDARSMYSNVIKVEIK